jgi:predicted nucleic acid-binding Zn ribbon protein
MATAKIAFTLGSINFSGEGEETWISEQLDKIIEKAPDLIKIALETQATTQPATVVSQQVSALSDDTISSQTLPNFLRAKGASSPAARKFLATAIWLHAKGTNRLSTGDVTKALRDSNQTRLPNPSQSLSKNVSKGFIEKDGSQFFVTDEGRASLLD